MFCPSTYGSSAKLACHNINREGKDEYIQLTIPIEKTRLSLFILAILDAETLHIPPREDQD